MKTRIYQETIILNAMEHFFPLKTTRRKSNYFPWMSKALLKKIAAMKDCTGWSGGGVRSEEWKEARGRWTGWSGRGRGVLNVQREHLLAEDANCNFFRHVKSFSTLEKPKLFDVRELFEARKRDKDIAESLANYFTKASRRFNRSARARSNKYLRLDTRDCRS